MPKLVIGLLMLPAVAMAQDDTSDARLRGLAAAAPTMAMERIDIEFTPAIEVEEITAVTADTTGNFYVLQRNPAHSPIVVTDPEGRVLRSFGNGLFARPHGIRVDPEGNVWTVDSNTSMVYKHAPAGDLLLEIAVGDICADPQSESRAASDVAFGADGQIYVSDGYCNSRVVRYDAAGRKLGEWGRPGTGPGEFSLLHAIAVGLDGNVYVGDRENGRIQWFTPEGDYIGEWHFGGRVLGLVFSTDGELYVSAEPKGAPPMEEGFLLHVDRRDGSVIGKIEAFGHQLSIGPDGALLPGQLSSELVIYRPRSLQ
jgi:DNA-binding beta-propeller fold protein YncE